MGAAGLTPGLEGIWGKKGVQPGLSPPPAPRGIRGHSAALCISEHPWAEKAMLGAAVLCLGTPVGAAAPHVAPLERVGL